MTRHKSTSLPWSALIVVGRSATKQATIKPTIARRVEASA